MVLPIFNTLITAYIPSLVCLNQVMGDSNTPGSVQILHDGEWTNYQENLSLKNGL